ncbi:TrbI/VirB10 family protein [Brevundimonas phoenicis]|uniref:TrbI/VirB10 family protein n=1 Tax=unclassified Brevundimonas TaxID=2622653 RepID=UPI0039B034C8
MTHEPDIAPPGAEYADGRASAPPGKAPAPDLALRAPRPSVVRLRRSAVQALVIGGAVLISGSLAWAFVVQPELRQNARARAADAGGDEARGLVRPAERVTEQPASYDRLPEPVGGAETPSMNSPSGAISASSGSSTPRYRDARSAAPPGPDPRELARGSALFFGEDAATPSVVVGGAAGPAAGASARSGQDADYGAAYNGHVLTAPLSPYELKAGAIIPAALLTAVDTARAGPVVATVTQNIYDTVSGRHLVVPQGARLIGRHEGESAYGDRRAFLVWERLILPNGKSLLLTDEPGVDAQGAVGVRGRVDRRLWPLLAGTLFAGAVTTLGQIARNEDRGARGLLGDAGDAAAIEGARVGGRLIDRELEVRPSIRLRAGAPVRVMITRDLILEPYRS